MFGIGEKFWQSSNYEIGLPSAATEPYNWRRGAFDHALEAAPSQDARKKLCADNAHWIERDKELEKKEIHG